MIKQIIKFIILPIIFLMFLTPIVFAQDQTYDFQLNQNKSLDKFFEDEQPAPVNDGAGQQLVNPMKADSINGIIVSIANWVLLIASPLAILMGIWAAVLFISAGDSPDRIKKGKETLTWAVIGLAVVLLANSMVNIIQTKIGETGNTPEGVVAVLTKYLPTIGGPLAIVMFIIGAFLYSTGNPKNITKANQIFIWTSVGLVLLIAAASIGTIVTFFIKP